MLWKWILSYFSLENNMIILWYLFLWERPDSIIILTRDSDHKSQWIWLWIHVTWRSLLGLLPWYPAVWPGLWVDDIFGCPIFKWGHQNISSSNGCQGDVPYSASSHGIVTKFWTYHDSTAVVACANFCSEHSITIRETTKRDSNRTWITSEKSFVKRALSAIYAPARPRCIFASACVYIEQIKGRRVITRRTLFCASTVDSTMPKCLTPSNGENLTRFRHIWFEYCHLRYFDIIWFDLADCQMNYKDISPRKRLTNEALVIPTLWTLAVLTADSAKHDDVIKWKHFPPYWPFSVRGIQR